MKIYKLLPLVALAFMMFGCAQIQNVLQPKSPTQTLKNFVEATQKKDSEAVKKSLSAGSLKMMEGLAKMQGKTLDETLKEGEASGTNYTQMPETRNEKINGDAATLEVKNDKTNEWDTLHFVKEQDEWKIALDKSIEEMFKKLSEGFKMPDFGNTNSATDDKSTEKKP